MTGEIALRPSYWASVSGGKDSLYMLNYILHNLDRYPLNGVVHFELEIDYPFIHDVIDYMESEFRTLRPGSFCTVQTTDTALLTSVPATRKCSLTALSQKPHTTFGLRGSVAKITESLC